MSSTYDEVMTMVHAFSDAGRRQAVRDLADRVAKLEAVAFAATAWNARICWEHTDPDDEEKTLHLAVEALLRSTDR